VNAAPVSGFVATPIEGIYLASKHAALGLTRTAAVEHGKYGIRVNAVSPGAVRTQVRDVFFEANRSLIGWRRFIRLPTSAARKPSLRL